jgi:predicted nucleic acid-binding protein
LSTHYIDSSALLKRVVREGDSSALRAFLRERDSDGDLLTASSPAWVEV